MFKKSLLAAALMFFSGIGIRQVQAQDRITPRNPALWAADTLWIGATFVHVTNDSVKVWLSDNEAGYTGRLSFIDPRNGSRDSLFTNHTGASRMCPTPTPCPNSINLSARHDIRLGDTVYFVYEVIVGGTANDKLPKYTGPNNNPASPYYSPRAHAVPVGSTDHRWSVAGRVNPTVVEFGFEDMTTFDSDMDYDDVIFRVSGLSLDVEKLPPPVADPKTRNFLSQVNVSLTAVTGAGIYYTTDGTVPDTIVRGSTKLYNGLINMISTTTLKAIAVKTGYKPSDVMTEVYTKVATPSTLVILDENGNAIRDGYLTENNPAYTIRIVTTQAGLADVKPNAVTLVNGDNESLTITSFTSLGDSLLYQIRVPLSIAAALANSNTEAAHYDTLRVVWKNPMDAKDSVFKKILIRPAPKQAQAFFSFDAAGNNPTDQYLGTETALYLIVVDQIMPAGADLRVILTTKPKVTGQPADLDTFTLAAIPGSPGKYRATLPVDGSKAGTPGDKQLQLANGDQITGTYKDPIDGDVAVANAGYGVPPVIDASLQFTDKAGAILANGIYYSPGEGALYLTYSDDWTAGNIKTKSVALTIVNNKGTGKADTETVVLTLDSALRVGSKGVWNGSIPLKDLGVTPRNNTAETYILGDVTARVTSHDETGANAAIVTDNLLVAWPNIDPKIVVEDPKGSDVITRVTDTLIIKIDDQSLSSGKDTIYVNLSCTLNGDVINGVRLVEVSPGHYVSVGIPKNEGTGVLGDGVLSCNSTDNIKVTYVDPVYGDPREKNIPLDNPVTLRLFYSASENDTTHIVSVLESDGDFFYAWIAAHGSDLNVAETRAVTLTTAQGESETFLALETGPHTQLFKVKIPYRFITSDPAKGNAVVEGKIGPQNLNNRVTANGKVVWEGQTATADILLIAAYVPVIKAYIKDSNGDGVGDKVYVEFKIPLGRLPATLDAQWNSASIPSKTATLAGGKLSFLNGNSAVVVADFTATPFGAGLTSHAATGGLPVAKLPDDALFAGQKPVIEDSLGPVILKAVKHPVNLANLKPGDPSFNLDTLFITVSEGIKPKIDMMQLIKFSTTCNDYDNARVVNAWETPTTVPGDPFTYKIVVNNAGTTVPLKGNCIYLNADSLRYTDLKGNIPPKVGVPLDGLDGDRIIQVFRGFPPVAGLDANDKRFQVAVQDSRDPLKGGISTPTGDGTKWQVNWIAPVGFDPGVINKGGDYVDKGNPKGEGTGIADPTRISVIPGNISAIQVVSTGRYVAQVHIFDNLGNFVKSFVQTFGYQGELSNNQRVVPKGVVSYLVWNLRDRNQRKVGNGVYVWKVVFTFENKKQEIQFTRTGVVRPQD